MWSFEVDAGLELHPRLAFSTVAPRSFPPVLNQRLVEIH